jgi:hypothetical protein
VSDHLTVEARTHRRTALVALRGELGVEEQLVLVDDPDDLAPPPWTE